MTLINNYISENKNTNISILLSESEFGRLHFIKSSRKNENCRICLKEIQLKESYFRQSVNSRGLFPATSRVCIACAKKLINEGTVYVDISEEELNKIVRVKA